MVDLWPDDIKSISAKPPVAILKEQGALLGRKTNNIVEGIVFPANSLLSERQPNRFLYAFYLSATALKYRYELLRISYSIDLYPVEIAIDDEVCEGLPAGVKTARTRITGRSPESTEDDFGTRLTAHSEDVFMEALKAIFATEKVGRVVGAMMAQSGVLTDSTSM